MGLGRRYKSQPHRQTIVGSDFGSPPDYGPSCPETIRENHTPWNKAMGKVEWDQQLGAWPSAWWMSLPLAPPGSDSLGTCRGEPRLRAWSLCQPEV